MVFVKVSETYDLSTKVNKMGIVGIHTPNSDLIYRHWQGLYMNFGSIRFASCDVAMACASILPADPLQVGLEAGSIAPQDMFNPILYKAVSNDSMNTFVQFLYGQEPSPMSGVVALNKGSVIDVHDTDFYNLDAQNNPVSIDQFNMYYGLLSNSSGFKKAMPQSGLTMKGLYPLVFESLSNVGYSGSPTTDGGYVPSKNDNGSFPNMVNYAKYIRGNAKRMPSIPTTYYVASSDDSRMSDTNSNVMQGNKIPSCYVGLIILPPAKLNQLYYRLKVTWTIEFSDIRSLTDIKTWSGLARVGQASYGTDYDQQSASMSSLTAMVDTQGADIEKVMEGST